jgi:hypothetical protein
MDGKERVVQKFEPIFIISDKIYRCDTEKGGDML